MLLCDKFLAFIPRRDRKEFSGFLKKNIKLSIKPYSISLLIFFLKGKKDTLEMG